MNLNVLVADQVTVHWCPADTTHCLHVMIGARGGPGWYVFVIRGCLGRVLGPFESEGAARYMAKAMQRPTRA